MDRLTYAGWPTGSRPRRRPTRAVAPVGAAGGTQRRRRDRRLSRRARCRPGRAARWRPGARGARGGVRPGRRGRRRADDVDVREHTSHELHPDLTLLLSTSGSTGSPKLVRLCAESLLANAESIVEALGIRATDVAATTLPLHYCYGLSVLHSHLLVGASLLLTERSVVDEEFWADVATHSVTTFPGVPHTYDLLERSGFADRDVPSLRYLTQAGGRMAPERVGELVALGRRKGFDLVVMYGQTEATARIAVLPPDLAEVAPGAIGRPVPGGRLSLRPVPGAEEGTGELVYEGPNVMLGYAETPADLALGRTTDVLATGDLGRLRPDGLWEVVGRLRPGREGARPATRPRPGGAPAGGARRRRLARSTVASVWCSASPTRPAASTPRRSDGSPARSSALPATAVDVVVRPELPAAAERQGRRARAGRRWRRHRTPARAAGRTVTLARWPDSTAPPSAVVPGRTTRSSPSAATPCRTSRCRCVSSACSAGCRTDWPTTTVAELAPRSRAAARDVAPSSRPTSCSGPSRSSASSARTPTSSPCWAGRTSCSRSSGSTWRASSSLPPAARDRVRAPAAQRRPDRRAVACVVIATVALWTDGLGWRQALLRQRRHQHPLGRAGLVLLVHRGGRLPRRRCRRPLCRRARVRPVSRGHTRSGCRSRSRSRRSSRATAWSAFPVTTSTARTCCSGCSRSAGRRPARPGRCTARCCRSCGRGDCRASSTEGGRATRTSPPDCSSCLAPRRPLAGGRRPIGGCPGRRVAVDLPAALAGLPAPRGLAAMARDRALPGGRGRRLVDGRESRCSVAPACRESLGPLRGCSRVGPPCTPTTLLNKTL